MWIHSCKSYLFCTNTGSNSAKGWVEPLQPQIPRQITPCFLHGCRSKYTEVNVHCFSHRQRLWWLALAVGHVLPNNWEMPMLSSITTLFPKNFWNPERMLYNPDWLICITETAICHIITESNRQEIVAYRTMIDWQYRRYQWMVDRTWHTKLKANLYWVIHSKNVYSTPSRKLHRRQPRTHLVSD